MTASNQELARQASEIARGSDGLRRVAANTASLALSTTGTVGAARSALADLWQKDVREAALDIIGRLAGESARAAWTGLTERNATTEET